MPNWSDWKARLESVRAPRQGERASDDAGALADLEHATRELETDLTTILQEVAAETSRADELEQRAMQAIRDGDDVAAREALLAHRECADVLARLEADAAGLRALIAECRAPTI